MMIRHFSLTSLLFAVIAASAHSDELSTTERFLHDGKFADGESALLLALDEDPDDDESRFGLGVIQFMRAVENLGQALYQYGAVADNSRTPFLRLPVPKNKDPYTVSYPALSRVLENFASDLLRAEATLAKIKDDDVKLKIRLSKVSFDFTGSGTNRTTLVKIIDRLAAGRSPFRKQNPDFQIHFDRGDVAWLRGYCHLLSGIVDAYRAFDFAPGFAERASTVFPKVETSGEADPQWYEHPVVINGPRLRRMREHFVKVCELNHETWKHIRAETDNDFEWLPHPKQTDQMNLPINDRQIDAWLNGMTQLEGLLKGERLLPYEVLQFVFPKSEEGLGLNVRKLLDIPPPDFDFERVNKNGINPKYLEDQQGREVLDIGALFQTFSVFQGSLGFAYGARLN